MKEIDIFSLSARDKARADKRKLRCEKADLQKAVLGLFVASIVVNTAQTATISRLEDANQRAAAQLQQAEQARDYAVQQLGVMVHQQEQDRQARADQAAAYEALGAYQYIGVCTITAYCSCIECCGQYADGLTATGIPAGPGIAAVDPNVIPLGSTVVIDGQKFLAADTGVTGNHVDVFMIRHADTVQHGVRTAEVWIEVEPHE